MNLAEIAIEKRTVTLVLTVVTIVAGLYAYENLSRLEDPEFTIKTALVITPYPGASPFEVEQEVTDRIEQAVQKLGQLKRVKESRSERGKSTVEVEIKDKYDKFMATEYSVDSAVSKTGTQTEKMQALDVAMQYNFMLYFVHYTQHLN